MLLMKRLLAVAFLLLLLPVAAAAQPPVREITRLAGDVYRFRSNLHYSIFAVTPADGTKYAQWASFKDWFLLNVEGMYREVQLHRRGN